MVGVGLGASLKGEITSVVNSKYFIQSHDYDARGRLMTLMCAVQSEPGLFNRHSKVRVVRCRSPGSLKQA